MAASDKEIRRVFGGVSEKKRGGQAEPKVMVRSDKPRRWYHELFESVAALVMVAGVVAGVYFVITFCLMPAEGPFIYYTENGFEAYMPTGERAELPDDPR